MVVEPFDKLGVQGRDFVIYDESGRERFSARLLARSTTLKVLWSDNIPWTGHRLREAQRLAGGIGSIDRIEGQASDKFKVAIKNELITAMTIAGSLNRALGGKWAIELEQTADGQVNVAATRLGE